MLWIKYYNKEYYYYVLDVMESTSLSDWLGLEVITLVIITFVLERLVINFVTIIQYVIRLIVEYIT